MQSDTHSPLGFPSQHTVKVPPGRLCSTRTRYFASVTLPEGSWQPDEDLRVPPVCQREVLHQGGISPPVTKVSQKVVGTSKDCDCRQSDEVVGPDRELCLMRAEVNTCFVPDGYPGLLLVKEEKRPFSSWMFFKKIQKKSGRWQPAGQTSFFCFFFRNRWVPGCI